MNGRVFLSRTGLLLLLCLLLPAAPLHAETLDAYLDRLQQAVAQSWSQLEPLWPGAGFADWVLLTTDGERAWALDIDGRYAIAPAKVLEQGVPNQYLQFGQGQWQGRPAIIVPLGPDPLDARDFQELESAAEIPFLFDLATHEAFHLFVQQRWPLARELNISARASRYPAGAEPRIARQHLLLALIEAYLQPERQELFLQEAAYWWQRWRREYADEAGALDPIDLFEGTARYIEQQAHLLARGLAPAQAGYHQLQRQRLLAVAESPYLSGDSESYHLGWLAGLLADRLQLDWRARAEAGQSPLTVLLQTRTARVSDPYPQRVEALYQLINRYNHYLARSIEPLLERWQNADEFVWLVVSGDSLAGAYEVGGFFRTATQAGTIHTGFRASHLLADQGWLQFTGPSLITPDQAPCGFDSAYVLPVRLETLRLQGQMAYPQAPFLQGQFRVDRSQQGAHTLYCAH